MEGIKINGRYYDKEAILAGIFQTGEAWQQELSAFLKEWFSDQDFVPGHTSGSTGKPQEIDLLKCDMIASAQITNEFFHLSDKSHLFLCLSPTYIAGKMMIVRAWLAGAELTVVKPSSRPCIEKDFDLAAMIPMQVQEILKSSTGAKELDRIKQLIIGGAPVSPALTDALHHLSVECFATYGMTETVSHIALKCLNGANKSSAYFALGNVWFETDDRGCLVIHAPHLKRECFVTNDMVRIEDARHFEWIGRYDHVINSGGIKLHPEAIEEKLSSIINERFFITSSPDDRLGEKMVLAIESEPWPNPDLENLQHRMAACLSKYELPQTIVFCKKFKETYSGKVVRKIG